MTYAELHRRWRGAVTVTAVALSTVALSVALTNSAEAKVNHNPIGAIESISQVRSGGIRVTGWAADPDSTRSVRYQILIDNQITSKPSLHSASKVRTDIARRIGLGSRHGVALNVYKFRNGKPFTPGKHRVCLKVSDIGPGTNTVVSCKTYNLNYNPTGKITSATQVPGGVRVSGWTYDRGSPLYKLGVTATVAGRAVSSTASHAVSGLSAISGPNHGFTVTVPVAANGTYSICVTARDVGAGSNTRLPCVTKALNFSPTGAITSLAQAPNGFKVAGWTTDPDKSTPLGANVLVDGVKVGTVTANGADKAKPGHSFSATYKYPKAGAHQVCVKAGNAPGTPGASRKVACQNISLNFNPTAAISSVTQLTDGRITVHGWSADPDISAAIHVKLALSGSTTVTVTANGTNSGSHSGHIFTYTWPVQSSDGARTVTATPVNATGTASGPGTPASARASITLNYSPAGGVESIARASAADPSVVVKGWAVDRNSTHLTPVTVTATVDGVAVASTTSDAASQTHAPVSGYPADRGFLLTLPTDDTEHSVCITARNDAAGASTSLGCKTIYAVNPTVPQAPAKVSVTSLYSAVAVVSWSPLARGTDGGGPLTSYTVRVRDASNTVVKTVTVTAPATSASVSGLSAKATYNISVLGTNSVGPSAESAAVAVTIASVPPPQTTPAPVSTSRYVRNIHDSNATDIAKMKAEGVADAKANPSGHRYLILLQIGGQDHYDGGVVLSAGVRFVTYRTVVANMESYLDGYASAQKASAPITIAIGTNSDMDVNSTTGAEWANSVIDPVVAYAKKYSGITVAGANDIEPGFRASYSQSAAWLSGYLNATSAPFIFNGSADGCSWTATGRSCNNGWTMAGLYNLAAGASPSRITNLPQIYNTTMPQQWKYISLTGVVAGKPRINFGGPLTEYTACSQAGSCGSIAGTTAWSQLWSQLQSDSRLKVASVPYSTDLRIDS